MHTDLYVYIHTNSSDSHLCSWVSCSWKLGYWNPAGKSNRNIYWIGISCFVCLGLLILHWQCTHHLVACLTQCVLGSSVMLEEHILLWLSQHVSCVRFLLAENCRWIDPEEKSNEYIKLLINILSEGVFLMPLLPVNQLRWSIWSGRTCFNSVLLLETPGESFHWIPTRNWEVTICARRSSVRSRTGISYFGCGIPVLFSWMRRPSRGLISEQAELKNSAACPGSGTAFTYVPCYWSVCIYAYLCCLSLLCWQLLNVGFYV